MGKILYFRDRRSGSPRVAVALPVALVHANGTVVACSSVDLSSHGLRVQTDRYTIDALHPSDQPISIRRVVRIDTHFQLPIGAGMVKIDAQCALAYVHDLPGGNFLIGLEFTRIEGECKQALDAFLAEEIQLEQYPD